MKKHNTLAIIFIFIGAVTLFGNMGIFQGDSFLLVLSAAFFGGYYYRTNENGKRKVGLLIPACILLAIGTYSVIEYFFFIDNEGSLFFFLIASAFVLIYVIHNMNTSKFGVKYSNWPLITGGIIYVFSGLLFLEKFSFVFHSKIFHNFWPIALIIIGVLLLNKDKQKKSMDIDDMFEDVDKSENIDKSEDRKN